VTPAESVPEPRPGLRRALSMRGALIVAVVAPMLIVVSSVVLFGLWALERQIEARMQDDVELVARALRLPVAHALERGQTGTVMQALRSAFEIRRVYGAQVFDAQGDPIASLGTATADDADGRRVALTEAGQTVGEYGSVDGEVRYSYFVPLADVWGQPLGLLQVTRARSDVQAAQADVRRLALLGILAGTVLVLLVVLGGHHRFVGAPIASLTRSMGRVREGDRSHRATPSGPLEVARLGRTFNAMLDSMRTAREELASKRLEQARLRVELANAEKRALLGDLAGGVAHELGSPLTVIDGRAQILLRAPDAPGSVHDAARSIRHQVGRMEATLRQLLSFGRSGTGRRRRVELSEVVRRALAAASEEAATGEVTLRTEGPDAGCTADLEPHRVEEAVVNLVRNACQASPGGTVVVRWDADDMGLRIDVHDDGPGVPEHLAPRVFEPFFSTKSAGVGVGLGLCVSADIVAEHGGELSLVPSSLGGAGFRITVPRNGSSAPDRGVPDRDTAEPVPRDH
jgi:two-component system, NtrC family, sensor kinase